MENNKMNEEKKLLERMAATARKAVEFFSSRMKPERERLTCIAFLRCLGVSFNIDDVKSSSDEPPDVIYNSARFEIVEILDTEKRHSLFKKRASKASKAKKLNQIIESGVQISRERIDLNQTIDLMANALSKKAKKYSPNVRANLDALVYVDLTKKYLYPESPVISVDKLMEQGWRSVSMVFSPYSHVFFTRNSEPGFLHEFEGQTKREWENPDTLFEL